MCTELMESRAIEFGAWPALLLLAVRWMGPVPWRWTAEAEAGEARLSPIQPLELLRPLGPFSLSFISLLLGCFCPAPCIRLSLLCYIQCHILQLFRSCANRTQSFSLSVPCFQNISHLSLPGPQSQKRTTTDSNIFLSQFRSKPSTLIWMWMYI